MTGSANLLREQISRMAGGLAGPLGGSRPGRRAARALGGKGASEVQLRSDQYEELCRFFLSEKFEIPVDRIFSPLVPNPRRPELPEYQHQIDLLWETGNDLAVYLHIANAKWRSSDKVDQPEVMLLQQVKQKVAAHKALMITSTGYTEGAVAVARDEGIALHVLVPAPALEQSMSGNRVQIRERLQSLAGSSPGILYSHRIETRAFDGPQATWPSTRVNPSQAAPSRSGYETRMMTGGARRATGGQPGPTQGAERSGQITRPLGPGRRK